MINYEKLWITLEKKKITQYQLINDYNVSRGLLSRLKNNESVTTNSIDMLCILLDCNVEDIMTCVKEEEETEEL